MIWDFGNGKAYNIDSLQKILRAAGVEVPKKPWWFTRGNYIDWLSDIINSYIVSVWLKEHGISTSKGDIKTNES